MGVQFNTPVLKNGLVFGLSNNDLLFCIDAKTGKTAWSAPAKGTATPAVNPGAAGGGGAARGGRGGRMGGGVRPGYGSIVDAGSVLIALTPSSELIVFEPSEKEFKKVASYKVAGSPTYAYPVISGNRVYVKDKDSVILWSMD
jgi:outer membrane protein assembly factor BamB